VVILADKLRALVAESGRAAVDRKANLPVNTVSNLINRRSSPQAKTALALAKALDVTLEWLLDDDRGMPPERPTEFVQATRLLDDEEHKELLDLAGRYGGLSVCIAAAIDAFLKAPEPDRKLAIATAMMRKAEQHGGVRG
jgi:transcriptional regulator with XRE-family HTH domain